MVIYFPESEIGATDVYTSDWPITVDGIRLDTLAWNVESLSGRDLVPDLRGSNVQVPSRHGSIFAPGKKYDDGKLILKMWVAGCDGAGGVPTNSYNEFRLNMDKLKALFGKRSGLLDVRKKDGAGGTRQAYCEMASGFDPDVFGVNPTGRFTVELDIPAVFWQDLTDVNHDDTTVNATSNDMLLTSFVGATAPMEELWIVVDGPVNNPKITDSATGHYVMLDDTLGSGEQWVVNTTTWSSKVGSSIAFTTGGTNAILDTISVGQHNPRYFALSPSQDIEVGPAINFSNTGGTSAATRIRVRGKRKYL